MKKLLKLLKLKVIPSEQPRHRQYCSTITQETTMRGSAIDTTSIDTHSTYILTHSILSNTLERCRSRFKISFPRNISILPRFWFSNVVLTAFMTAFKLYKHEDFFLKFLHTDLSQCQALISKRQAVPARCIHMMQTCWIVRNSSVRTVVNA